MLGMTLRNLAHMATVLDAVTYSGTNLALNNQLRRDAGSRDTVCCKRCYICEQERLYPPPNTWSMGAIG